MLDGAKALALPTKFGQDLIVEPGNDHEIQWTSYDDDGSFWFEDTFTFDTIKNKTAFENQPVKTMLIAILHEASVLNPDFLNKRKVISSQLGLRFLNFGVWVLLQR